MLNWSCVVDGEMEDDDGDGYKEVINKPRTTHLRVASFHQSETQPRGGLKLSLYFLAQ